MNLDLFSYNIYQNCQYSHDKVMELVRRLWKEVFYKKAKAILQNHGLNIERKKYYNLTQRKAIKKLNF